MNAPAIAVFLRGIVGSWAAEPHEPGQTDQGGLGATVIFHASK